MSPWSRIFYLAVLMSAVIGDAAVLYFSNDPNVRLILGLMLLPMVLWAGTRLEVMELLANQARWASRGRVFRELRSQVVLLLEQVRRLNWIAVDAERGFRDKDEAMKEMDVIEEEIRGIITDVRRAAGKPTAVPEMSPEKVQRTGPDGVPQTSLVEVPQTSSVEIPQTGPVAEPETVT